MEDINKNRNYCVYIHTSPSGKKYVGQTGKKPEERWGKNGVRYLKKEKNGEYMHIAFARAILKYGWDNIEHEIVATNLTREEANNLEISLIKELKTKNRQYGYNLKDGGIGGGGFSEETLKKMSESHKGKKQSEETIRKRAEKLRGENNPMYGKHLSEETKRKMKESRKWYTPSEETRRKMSESHKGMTHSEETKKKISNATKGENNPFYGKCHTEESLKKMSESHKGVNMGIDHFASKKVCQYDLQGNLIEIWDCMSEAERKLNISNGSIYNCCKGIQKKAGGFIWRYADEKVTDEYIIWCNELHSGGNQKKPIVQYSLNNDFLCLFDSITEAGAKTGVDKGSISACCRGRNKTAGGFVWKYYNEENLKIAI